MAIAIRFRSPRWGIPVIVAREKSGKTGGPQRSPIAWILRFFVRVARLTWFVLLHFVVWPLIRDIARPRVVFAVYPGRLADKRAFLPAWTDKLISGAMPLGVIWQPKGIGMLGAHQVTADELDADPNRITSVLDEFKKQFPRTGVFALAGRLPSIARRAGHPLTRPFVDGVYGTIYAMTEAAKLLATRVNRPSNELSIIVFGGSGLIGSALVNHLTQVYSQVIAFDPRFIERAEIGNVVQTSNPLELCQAHVAILLSGRGDDIEEQVPYLPSGLVLGDDTHPYLSSRLRAALHARGVIVLKAVTRRNSQMFPRLPGFSPPDVPACLLQALVVSECGWEVLSSQETFSKAAAAVGFKAHLVPHIDA